LSLSESNCSCIPASLAALSLLNYNAIEFVALGGWTIPAKIRKSAVAGTFYPGTPQEIRKALDALRERAGDFRLDRHPPILIVPHAGWVYSGLAAVRGIITLVKNPPKRIVLIGPSHYHYFMGFSIGGYEKYQTPLGELDGDLNLQQEISDATGFGFIEEAHSREHSIEVILPMLQHILPAGFKILPIQSGSVSRADIGRLADSLASSLDPLTDALIISTDLSHFYTYEEARRLDSETIESILQGDDESIIERSGEGGRLCCGFTGVVVAIDLAGKWGLGKPEVLMYYNSGDSGGDKFRVVGYAAITYPPPQLEDIAHEG
jgi:AmmeMemoRadiSam system protein B